MKIISWIKEWFRRPDYAACDKFIANLSLVLFMSSGSGFFYPDAITKLPIFTIIRYKKRVSFQLDPNKLDWANNVGYYKFNRQERWYIFTKIVDFGLEQRDKYIKDTLKIILEHYNINENEFAFLVKNCRE